MKISFMVAVKRAVVAAALSLAACANSPPLKLQPPQEEIQQQDVCKTMEQCRQAAEQGNLDAQFKFGEMHWKGEGAEMDEVEALRWFLKAAKGGHAQAQFNLGKMYNGSSLKRNDTKALKWFRAAAEQGHVEAQNQLGEMYSDGGWRLKGDDTEAVKWFRMAAEQGSLDAQFKLEKLAREGRGGLEKNEAEALKRFEALAGQGHEGAKAFLSRLEALKQLQEVTQKGDVKAQFHLAERYFYMGEETEALKWFLKAAKTGDAQAQFNLGKLYDDWSAPEEGVISCRFDFGYEDEEQEIESDEAKAAKWYQKAAQQGHAPAQYHLGRLYTEGRGVARNPTEALKWFLLAAEQAFVEAQFKLGEHYALDEDVASNPADAMKWLLKATEKGHAGAKALLADLEDAKRLEEAAQEGDAQAQFHLAERYAKGRGVVRDKEEALLWMKKAAEQGHMEAQLGEVVGRSQKRCCGTIQHRDEVFLR